MCGQAKLLLKAAMDVRQRLANGYFLPMPLTGWVRQVFHLSALALARSIGRTPFSTRYQPLKSSSVPTSMQCCRSFWSSLKSTTPRLGYTSLVASEGGLMSKLAVVAIGGNSLIKDEAHKTVPDQFAAVRETSVHIAEMIAQGWNIVITHGNGPQVGFILLRSEYSRNVLHTVPLDSCGADTQGAIGYMIQQALHNEFLRRDIQRQCVTVVTQVLIDSRDPAMQHPSKPIGSFYREEDAQVKMSQEGWTMVEDAGRGWRRVVPSPQPREIIEREAIETLIS